MYLSSLGVYNIFEKYPYLTELSLVLEITVFSLALASKIKMLNQEKQISKQRALLLKELNHRFKNSMQTILSFLFFQKEKTEDKKINEILTNLENRIVATTNLYSLLQTQDNTIVVNTDKYFSLIIKNGSRLV
jgi:two-component sensor histidine kinase